MFVLALRKADGSLSECGPLGLKGKNSKEKDGRADYVDPMLTANSKDLSGIITLHDFSVSVEYIISSTDMNVN